MHLKYQCFVCQLAVLYPARVKIPVLDPPYPPFLRGGEKKLGIESRGYSSAAVLDTQCSVFNEGYKANIHNKLCKYHENHLFDREISWYISFV